MQIMLTKKEVMEWLALDVSHVWVYEDGLDSGNLADFIIQFNELDNSTKMVEYQVLLGKTGKTIAGRYHECVFNEEEYAVFMDSVELKKLKDSKKFF